MSFILCEDRKNHRARQKNFPNSPPYSKKSSGLFRAQPIKEREPHQRKEKESPLPLFAGTYTLPPVGIGLGWFGYIDKGAD